MSTSSYASFGRRFVAVFIDGILLQLFFFITTFEKAPAQIDNPKAIFYYIFTTIFAWVYFASMESSVIQATFGKRLLGIIVTDKDGKKISFAKATARYFSKSFFIIFWIFAGIVFVMAASTGNQNSPYLVLAGLLFIIGLLIVFIGYLMALFTPEKQALHDIIARCLVVKGSGQSVAIPWKALIGLAIAAVLAGRVLAQVPGATIAPTPTDTNTDPPVTENDKPSSNTSNNCASLTNNIFQLELTEANTYINGNWKLGFANGIVQHEGLLSMKDSSGILIVRFPDDDGSTKTVRQNMQLCSSARGLVLLGENPIDLKTNETSPTYAPDNFIIAQGINGQIFRNYSRNNNNIIESPVEREFLGYSAIGIQMVELNSEVLEKVNKEGKIPFNLSQDTGILIHSVENNSNAQEAGLEAGDIILSVDSKEVTRITEVQAIINSSLFGSTLKFEVDRNGENKSLNVTAGCCVLPEKP
ncbi:MULTISPECIES: RDD family protein [Calothrix]|uniref:RDD family protein n=2 Tax=Calothrix TaxID=1186 RepID=A0ABR8AHA8_9CYAN|nr:MULTISPECIES: RDD family protein [Calothrix]MBD2199119.1 RDD family protein [Calothrix parietina FACHB-288]MBD2227825.1 RDD family protein [Calothrix anomala FACHB-343]